MHSEECLSFLPRYLRGIPGVALAMTRCERARRLDFARAWWTPPLAPAAALRLEQDQIAALDLHPMVSLTDHDNIQAPLALSAASEDIPVSVEWTAPYARSIFHLGVHNIPRARAADWLAVMAAYAASPLEPALAALLREFARDAGTLIVLNHPFWLEEGVEPADHAPALARILRDCGPWLHAFELNGTRPWRENADTIGLARAHNRPVISGGDRHACEPSACINVTGARSFAEFVSEVRGGESSVVFMPQYRQPLAQRFLEAIAGILRDYPEYPDRKHWTSRMFYRGEDGVARTLAQIWRNRPPRLVSGAVSVAQFLGGARLRPALRLLLSERGELRS